MLFLHSVAVLKITTRSDMLLSRDRFTLLNDWLILSISPSVIVTFSWWEFDLAKKSFWSPFGREQPWMWFNCHCKWREGMLKLWNMWLYLDYLKFSFLSLSSPLPPSFELISVCVAVWRQGSLPRSYITVMGWHKRGCTKDLEGLNTLLCV